MARPETTPPRTEPIVHHDGLRGLLRTRYESEDLEAIEELLRRSGTLDFPALDTGLFPAVPRTLAAAERSGYGNVWMRDNVHVAHAHLVGGEPGAAARCARSLARFVARSSPRFRCVVADPAVAEDPRKRPHVRFDGVTLAELDQPWPHAQNDALGAFLWLFCRMLALGALPPADGDLAALTLLFDYFAAVRYWEDEDSGHWEEARKVSASSIGAVVAGLRELEALLRRGDLPAGSAEGPAPSPEEVRRLAERGRASLERILPAECDQEEPGKARRHDAALLFLVHPFGVVPQAMGDVLVEETLTHLEGEHGIRRYRGDSYWAPDYERHLERERASADPMDTMRWRDALSRPGREAEWCLFDPLVSTIFGERYQRSGDPEHLQRQVRHFNRALGQLTGEGSPHGALRCPEAYYVRAGQYVPNDQTPLLWTQANLRLALACMKASARRVPRPET